MFMLLVAAAFALSFDGTGDVSVDAGDVPRNVRYLPFRLYSMAYRLAGHPFVRLREDVEGRKLLVVSGTLPADRNFRVIAPNGIEIVRFHTNDRVDLSAPIGGALLGVTRGREAVVLLFSPPVDESSLWAEVQWRDATRPDGAVVVALGRPGPTWTAPPRDSHAERLLVDFDVEVSHALDAEEVNVPIVAASVGRAPRDAWLRVRWLDAAGNATPWTDWAPLALPPRGIRCVTGEPPW